MTDNDFSRWFLEITAGGGHCAGHLCYSHGLRRPVVWSSTVWTLPAMPLTERMMLGELVDLGLVLMESNA